MPPGYASGVATLVLGPPPPELQALLERRRRAGLDRFDEVWDGMLHMITAPGLAHARVLSGVMELIAQSARASGLIPASGGFNLGESLRNFRVPDGGLHRPGASGLWLSTAALVVEIISPDDETYEKLPFYAEHNVDEVAVADPVKRTVEWLALTDGRYEAVDHSRLIDLSVADLAREIEWP